MDKRTNTPIYQAFDAANVALDVIGQAVKEMNTMLPFNSWGNPYQGDVPMTGYRTGRLKNKEDATWTIQFIDGSTMDYDCDMLMKPSVAEVEKYEYTEKHLREHLKESE